MKYWKLLGWLGVYALIYLLSSLLAGVAIGFVYLIDMILAGEPLPMDQFLAENMTIMLIISGVLTIIFGFVVLLLRGRKPLKFIQFRALSIKNTLLMAIMGVGCAFFVNSLMTIIRIDQYLPDNVTEQLMEMMTGNVFLAFLAIGIIVPIYEEILVRGLIFSELRINMKLWLALVLQGLIFGLMHGNLLQFSYTFPVGIVLGIVYVKYRSIWAPILIHLVWNSTSMLMGYLMPETSEASVYVAFLIFGAALFFGGATYSLLMGPSINASDKQMMDSLEPKTTIPE